MTGLRKNPSQRMLDLYGCSKEEWIKMRDLGLQMISAGICNKDTTPLRAYQHQRTAALNKRGIEWNLTLMAWWGIWDASGHWSDRGIGRGWHMCRKGDQGAYEVGNVFIGEGVGNLSAAAKNADLPIGVAYTARGKSKPYRAYCNVYGRQRHIGMFSTVEEAEQAYRKAVRLDDEMKALADARFDLLKSQVQHQPLSIIERNKENGAKALASRIGRAA